MPCAWHAATFRRPPRVIRFAARSSRPTVSIGDVSPKASPETEKTCPSVALQQQSTDGRAHTRSETPPQTSSLCSLAPRILTDKRNRSFHSAPHWVTQSAGGRAVSVQSTPVSRRGLLPRYRRSHSGRGGGRRARPTPDASDLLPLTGRQPAERGGTSQSRPGPEVAVRAGSVERRRHFQTGVGTRRSAAQNGRPWRRQTTGRHG